MAITIEQLNEIGIPIDDTPMNTLYALTAIDWIGANTTLKVDIDDISVIDALPYPAKLFIAKYTEAVGHDRSVTSESLGGMSQSFSSETSESLLWDLANSLLGAWLKSQVTFIQAQKRWCHNKWELN